MAELLDEIAPSPGALEAAGALEPAPRAPAAELEALLVDEFTATGGSGLAAGALARDVRRRWWRARSIPTPRRVLAVTASLEPMLS